MTREEAMTKAGQILTELDRHRDRWATSIIVAQTELARELHRHAELLDRQPKA